LVCFLRGLLTNHDTPPTLQTARSNPVRPPNTALSRSNTEPVAQLLYLTDATTAREATGFLWRGVMARAHGQAIGTAVDAMCARPAVETTARDRMKAPYPVYPSVYPRLGSLANPICPRFATTPYRGEVLVRAVLCRSSLHPFFRWEPTNLPSISVPHFCRLHHRCLPAIPGSSFQPTSLLVRVAVDRPVHWILSVVSDLAA
jgi:hypothetical protein